MSQPNLLSGARGLIKRKSSDGSYEPLYVVTSVSISTSIGVRQTFVIGSKNPINSDPVSITARATIGRVIPVNQPTSSSADQSKVTAIDLKLEEKIFESLEKETLIIEVQDRVTGKTVGALKEARFAGRDMGDSAGDLAGESIRFEGIWDAGYDGSENVAVLLGYDSSNA